MIELFTHRFRAMGSPCSLFLFCESHDQMQRAVDSVVNDIDRLEQKYSRFKSDSLLSTINAHAGKGAFVVEDEETQALLNYAHQAWLQSDGLFDISSGHLSKLWDFKIAKIPSDLALHKALSQSGWEKVSWNQSKLELPAGMQLDFGGVVKEYAADCAVSALKNLGVTSALIELGGDIAVLGDRPDQEAWKVGLKHPRKDGAHRRIEMTAGAIASSGDYERFFEYQGRRYSHVINPKTAKPAEGPAAVSVIADACVIAGTAATVAMCSDERLALEWLTSLGLPFVCVLQDGSVEENL